MIHKGTEEAPGLLLVQDASIGEVDSTTLVVRFSRAVDTGSTYDADAAIYVNAAPVSISSATRQADHSIVHYVIPAIDANDSVVFVYAAGASIYDEYDNDILLASAIKIAFSSVGTYLNFDSADNSMHLLTLEL